MRASHGEIDGGDGGVSRIRVLLFDVHGMMDEILRSAIAAEPGMTVVDCGPSEDAPHGERLGAWTRRRRIDVVIRVVNDDDPGDRFEALLRANPRLGVVAIDASRGTATLHHLVPAHDAIGPLARDNLIGAIRAGGYRRVG